MITRRQLLLAAGTAAFTAPLASFAQQARKVWRIGVLWPRSRSTDMSDPQSREFKKAFADLGYVEGQNLTIETRYAEGRYERLPVLAAELVKLKVDLIIVSSTPPALAVREVTKTIPIVVTSFGDPVRSGLAESLAHPGGNVTGFSNLSGDLEEKRLELLIGTVPKASRIAQLVNPANPSTMRRIPGLTAAAQKSGREFLAVEVRGPGDLDDAFSRMVKERVGALMVPNESAIAEQARRIAELALRHKLPSIFGSVRGPAIGGLMSYGPAASDLYHRVAILVDKIFKGAKPGDLPIEQPTKLELVINLKTAKTLGLRIPESILLRADKVIE